MLKKVIEYPEAVEKSENLIIKGNNKDVLPLLDMEKRIKCIYIDPPYNNGEKYEHYHDNKTHDIWLTDIKETLLKLEPLLSDDGSIWISIDDSELHYLKVLADEVFGRKNFINTIIWQHRTTRENRKAFSNNHEYILVYAKNPKKFTLSRNLLPATQEMKDRYKNPDNDKRGKWQSVSVNVQNGHAVKSQYYEIVSPTGKIHNPPKGRCWAYNEKRMLEEIKLNNIWFGLDGNGVPRKKKFLKDSVMGVASETLWMGEDVGTTKQSKKHILKLFPNQSIFETPKPEELIKRIFDIATNEGDTVLDAYLGSGTTIAVAHKMNRKYIGIESGNHISEYVIERVKQVINNTDDGGITKILNWKGGGSFSFLEYKSPHQIPHNIFI